MAHTPGSGKAAHAAERTNLGVAPIQPISGASVAVAVPAAAPSPRTTEAADGWGSVSKTDPTEEADPFAEDELVGTTLSDTYLVLRVLGEGGMGRVYEAQHTRIASKRFAIKTLHPELARRSDVLARFQREAEAAASINHRNVVGVYDVNTLPSGQPYMVSELLEGSELGDYLDGAGRIPIPQAVGIVRQVCTALAAAHGRGVVHRDVKPENCFLTGDAEHPVVKVLDFGISRLEGQAGNTLTRTGMVMGTPSYMAPEQARGERVDHRTDLYATGAILYRALTGRMPFDRADATATLAAVLTEEPERPRAIAPEIPEPLELIIQRAMARDPDDRFQTMEQLHLALEPFDEMLAPKFRKTPAGGRSVLPSQTSKHAAKMVREARDARPRLVLLALAAVLGVAFGFVATMTGVIRLVRGGPLPELSGIEATVIVVGAVCAMLAPVALVARHVVRTRWDNTAKVLELVQQLAPPVLIGLAASGLMALTVLVLESTLLRNSPGMAWPTWGMLVPGVGVTAAIAVALADRADPSSIVGRLAGARTFAASAAAVTLLVVLAVALRGGSKVEVESVKPTADEAEAATASTAETEAQKPHTWTEDSEQIWKDFLRYKRLNNVASALDALDRALKADNGILREREVRKEVVDLIAKAMYVGGVHGKRMTSMLLNDMGETGPDLLFEVLVSRGRTAAAKTAQRLLADATVRAKGSKGMRIAYALRTASSCENKKALFPRVIAEGDSRALRELEIMQTCIRGMTSCCLRNDADLQAAMASLKDKRQ